MGTPREPFLKKGDRVLHRLTDKEGTVTVVQYRLDADRAHVRFDDGTEDTLASSELSPRRHLPIAENKVVTVTIQTEKSCDTCVNKCMDMEMDPYCAAVNKPWGRVLHRGQPEECGTNFKLWEPDTRRQR